MIPHLPRNPKGFQSLPQSIWAENVSSTVANMSHLSRDSWSDNGIHDMFIDIALALLIVLNLGSLVMQVYSVMLQMYNQIPSYPCSHSTAELRRCPNYSPFNKHKGFRKSRDMLLLGHIHSFYPRVHKAVLYKRVRVHLLIHVSAPQRSCRYDRRFSHQPCHWINC